MTANLADRRRDAAARSARDDEAYQIQAMTDEPFYEPNRKPQPPSRRGAHRSRAGRSARAANRT